MFSTAGDEKIADAKSYLQDSIVHYHNALANIGVRISSKQYEHLDGTAYTCK